MANVAFPEADPKALLMDRWWSEWGVREVTSYVRVERVLFREEMEPCDHEESPRSGRADVPEVCHEEKR